LNFIKASFLNLEDLIYEVTTKRPYSRTSNKNSALNLFNLHTAQGFFRPRLVPNIHYTNFEEIVNSLCKFLEHAIMGVEKSKKI